MVWFKLIIFFLGFIYFNHIAACLMFYIGKIQYEDYEYVRFDNRTWIKVFGEPEYHDYEPLLEMSMFDAYVNCLYWAYACWGTVAYGDIIPVTPAEKLYVFLIMIIAKIFTAFIYAEAASVVSNYHAAATEHNNRKTLVKQWMNSKNLPLSLQKRVFAFYDLLWNELKGHDDTAILNMFPESLQTDIRF